MKLNYSSLLGFSVAFFLFPHLVGCGGSRGSASTTLATPTISWPAPAAIHYGTALSSIQLNATANYAGTFTYSPATGAVLGAGMQTLTATFTPSSSSTVASAKATNSITVNKATPTITWATPAAVSAGTALSSTQLDATASVAGAFAYSPAAGTILTATGAVTLSVTFTPTDSADYNSATASVTLSVNGATPSYAWSNVRIVAGGYITGVYFHPTQQNLMYARTDIGGVYRWGPNDTQWVPLLDWTSRANVSLIGVESVGLDPTNPNNLYLDVGEYAESWGSNGAMLVSTDQGNTFTTVPLPFKNGSNDLGRGTGERIAVDPNLPGTLYFGTRQAGLQLSKDSGSTWSQSSGLPVTSTANGDGIVAVLPVKASGSSGSETPVVYTIVGGTGTGTDPQGVYVTSNGGSTTSIWTAVTGQPSFAAAATPLAPVEARIGPNGALYVLYGDQPGPNTMTVGELWKFVPSSNWTSGAWTQIALPNQTLTINISNGYGGLAVDPSHAGYLMLGTLDQYWPTADVVYRSSDDGATWRDVSSVNILNGYSKSPGLATHDVTLAPYMANGDPATVSTGNWATAIAIDPFNADHAMYGTGGALWSTIDLTKADPSATSLGIVDWTVGSSSGNTYEGSYGIEETAVEGLWAPPSGSTLLLSAIGDVHGFAHQDLTVSPAEGSFTNPAGTPSSMDFEQNTPTTVVRVTPNTACNNNACAPLGVISTDGGLTWTAFASNPSGTAGGGGQIAIAPDGSSMVWSVSDTSSVWYSKNGGSTWTASTGIAAQAQVVSDRVTPGVFYGLSNGTLAISTDGGATFTSLQTGLPGNGVLVALPDAQGDLWIAGQSSGLYSNAGSAASPQLTAVSGVEDAYNLGFGKAAPGSNSLTLFLDGQIAGAWGLYRSTNGGSSWIQINDPAHQWGGFTAVCGDMRTFGTVYLGTRGGRGIVWGTSTN